MPSDPLSDADTRVRSLAKHEVRELMHPASRRLGPYHLLRPLGSGGMAEVWLARAERGDTRRLHVIKVILPQLARERRFLAMFRREARVAMRLKHPNIVEVYGVIEDGGEVGLVMEHLEGLTLFDLAARSWLQGRSLPLEPLLQIMIDAARALHFAHHLEDGPGGVTCIVHRDVSPDNLLVTKQGRTKLLDFGVAKPDDDAGPGLTATGQVKGKVSFMSPEQARGEELDGRSDLFSLGVCLYWLLTGVRPFDRDDPVATMEAVLVSQPPPPSRLNRRVPPALEEVVLRLLERDRRSRTASGAELADQLTALLRRVPEDHLSPGRLIENVMDLDEGPDRPRPTFVAMPSVDWTSGEGMGGHDPSAPRALTGEWAALQTRQLPVWGLRASDSDWAEVFTGSHEAARDEPPTVPMDPGTHLSFPSDVETAPGEDPLTGPLTGPLTVPDVEGISLSALSVDGEEAPTLEVPTEDAAEDAADIPTTAPVSLAESRLAESQGRALPWVALGAIAVVILAGSALWWKPWEPAALPRAEPPPTPVVVQPAAEPPGPEPAAAVVEEEAPEEKTPKRQRKAPVAERSVVLRAPAHVQWRVGKRVIARGSEQVSVPAGVKRLRAWDPRRRVAVEVPIGSGEADYEALRTERLRVEVRPWAKVSLGKEELGMTPLEPVPVVPGLYKVRLEHEGEVREERVRVRRGAGDVVLRVDMRE